MKILYFSLGYSTHDYRFLKAISDGGYEVFFVQLEGNQRQVESRTMPEHVNQVIWKGGCEPFRWSSLAKLTFDFRRLTKEIKPVLHRVLLFLEWSIPWGERERRAGRMPVAWATSA